MYRQGGGGWGRLVVAGEGGRQRRSAGVGLWCVIIVDVVLWKVRCNVDTHVNEWIFEDVS